MKVIVGADHAGFELKESLKPLLTELGHVVTDVGTDSTDAVDYPDIATALVAEMFEQHEDVETWTDLRGILICGSGVGVSVAANKFDHIRAAICHDSYTARQGVEHDDMNVLVMGSRVVGNSLAQELVRSFLGAAFTSEERHQRRLEKVKQIEAN